ncbi:MAG: DUF4230 domain-containing protein [Anaerolineales bacterium]|nr:DUF4230 domain-containing protein [Anaerolineales bacterium]
MDNKTKNWIVVIGLVLLIGTVVTSTFYITKILDQTLQSAQDSIQPVRDLTGDLSTQVSQVLHPTPTILPDPVSIIHEVRSLARLETIQYSIEKIVTAENGQSLEFLFGDKLLFVAHGTVIAGIDLEKIETDDISVDQTGTVTIKLPEAEVFIATLDNQKSYVYDRETGLLSKGSPTLETDARKVAEDEILKSAIEDGILEQARENAEVYILRLMLDLGFTDVIFQ